jgi:3-methyladenine DNA glycosylase Tag
MEEVQMSVDDDMPASEMETLDGSIEPTRPESLEDGRTRCTWVHGRPEHYLFHDAEWGRLPQEELACFELVMLSCFERDVSLVEVLDQRTEIFQAFAEWDYETVAKADDAALEAMVERGGVFDSIDRLKRLRDVAGACARLKGEFKGVREYFLAMPAMTAEEQLADVVARFPGFSSDDAARLIQMMGCVGGAIQQWSHERDCWIY